MQTSITKWAGALALLLSALFSGQAHALPPDQEQAFIQRSRPFHNAIMETYSRETEAINRRTECIKQNRPSRQNFDRVCPNTEILAAQSQRAAAKASYDQIVAEYNAAEAEYQRRLAAEPKPATAAPPQPQKQAPPKATASNKQMIVSGNWAASCVEQNGGSGLTVVCQRYGGFLENVFPSGCEGNNLFVCRNRSLCSVAADVAILSSDASPRLQSGIENCPGHRAVRN